MCALVSDKIIFRMVKIFLTMMDLRREGKMDCGGESNNTSNIIF